MGLIWSNIFYTNYYRLIVVYTKQSTSLAVDNSGIGVVEKTYEKNDAFLFKLAANLLLELGNSYWAKKEFHANIYSLINPLMIKNDSFYAIDGVRQRCKMPIVYNGSAFKSISYLEPTILVLSGIIHCFPTNRRDKVFCACTLSKHTN